MSHQIEVTRKYVNELAPAKILTDDNIRAHVVKKMCTVFQESEANVLAFYEREKDNFAKRISENKDLRECTPMSTFMALTQVFGWKLSLEAGSQQDVYLIPGNVNVGTKDNPQWEKQMAAQPTPYGEKKIRIETGQVRHVDKPVVVYDCDHYVEKTDDERGVVVEWTKGVRSASSKITGSFIRIQKRDGSFEFKTFDITDIERWKASSAKKNRDKGANVLYTSNNGQIDPLFLEGKTLKHAFKLYPRVVNSNKLPETFQVDPEVAVRNGLDMSDFNDTEDVTHEEIPSSETDEFEQAITEEVTGASQAETVKVEDDDYPNFD